MTFQLLRSGGRLALDAAAVDAGDIANTISGCNNVAFDQRSAERPASPACDAGAVEYGSDALKRVYVPVIAR